jgi:HAD superfamily hydrolase (TIGR01662 family)
MKKKKDLIIFDLDGVLLDSIKVMEFAWKKTLITLKTNNKPPFFKYKKLIGLPFFSILKKLNFTKKEFKKIKFFYNKFSIFYTNKYKLKIKNHYINVLRKLKKNKIKICIFTSKSKSRTLRIIKNSKFKFDYVVTADDVLYGKPNPHGINIILKKFKISKKKSIYIGDTMYDLLAAKKAGIDYLHANWGYGNCSTGVKRINNIFELLKFL